MLGSWPTWAWPACSRKPFTTTADATAPRAPDLEDRRFVADRPNQRWVADIT